MSWVLATIACRRSGMQLKWVGEEGMSSLRRKSGRCILRAGHSRAYRAAGFKRLEARHCNGTVETRRCSTTPPFFSKAEKRRDATSRGLKTRSRQS